MDSTQKQINQARSGRPAPHKSPPAVGRAARFKTQLFLGAPVTEALVRITAATTGEPPPDWFDTVVRFSGAMATLLIVKQQKA